MLGNVIPIKGKNTIIIKEYDNKDLLFYPHSEVTLVKHNVKLINNTDEYVTISYNEALKTGPCSELFHGLKFELLGDEIIGR